MKKVQKCIPLLMLLLGTGCSLLGGKTGYTVATKLKQGMTKDDVLNVLSQGATYLEEKSSHSPDSQTWDNIIELKPVLTALKNAEEETGITVHKYVEVSRTWGFMGFDIFHLFLSEDEILIGYTQQHIN